MRLFVNRHDTKCGGRIPTNSLQIVANFLTGFDECCLITIDTGTDERELWVNPQYIIISWRTLDDPESIECARKEHR